MMALRAFHEYANVWVEITSTEHGHGGPGWELGTCLWSPAKNQSGADRYALMRKPQPGDLVLHFVFSRWPDGARERRLIAYSTVKTGCQTVPHEPPSPGQWAGRSSYYRIDIENYTELPTQLSTDQFAQKHEADLLSELRDGTQSNHPFSAFGEGARLNAGLYLRRCSERLYRLLLSDLGAPDVGESPPVPFTLGIPYQPADEDVHSAARNPFQVDPDQVDRGNRGHATTQNALAEHLRRKGLEPRRPCQGEPEYDLAWIDDGGLLWVAEVKSITDANEMKQLRLGLGQVLHYRHLLAQSGKEVVAVLVAEREPTDKAWIALCDSLSVRLWWPGTFSSSH